MQHFISTADDSLALDRPVLLVPRMSSWYPSISHAICAYAPLLYIFYTVQCLMVNVRLGVTRTLVGRQASFWHLPFVLLLPSLAILDSPSLSCMSIVSVTCCFLSTQTSIYLEKRWFDFGVFFLGCASSLDIERSLPTWLRVVFFQFGFPHLGVATRHLKFRIRVFFLDEMSSKTDEPHLSKALVFNLPLFLSYRLQQFCRACCKQLHISA